MEQNNNATPAVANKKNLIISGAVILIVLVALFVIPTLGDKKAAKVATEETGLPEGCEPGFLFSETTGEPCPKDETTPAPTATGALSRADALVKYEGNTITFTGDCAAAPATFTVPAGKTIMLNNETAARRTIMVGAKSYSVGSFGYTLSSMNMGVGEHTVSCDGKAASKIVIQ